MIIVKNMKFMFNYVGNIKINQNGNIQYLKKKKIKIIIIIIWIWSMNQNQIIAHQKIQNMRKKPNMPKKTNACISKKSLLQYKKTKFKVWKNALLDVSDLSTLKRLLRIGLIINIYDYTAFPSRLHEINDWKQWNEDYHKIENIPRPVYSLRIWNVTNKCYDIIDPHLDGEPKTIFFFMHYNL